jgi:heme exporter protein C
LNLYHYASPATFYPLAGKLVPWFAALALVLAAVGLYISFFVAPTDFQQGEGYRIIFIHVPAAWMSMFIYLVMAFWSAIGLAWNTRLSFVMARALAPTGAMFTFVALWTGAFWGKPMWGAWWVWDARLTSELILLFLYVGVMALQAAIDDPRRADRAGALLNLVGVINVPIIYFSVNGGTPCTRARRSASPARPRWRRPCSGACSSWRSPPGCTASPFRWRAPVPCCCSASGRPTGRAPSWRPPHDLAKLAGLLGHGRLRPLRMGLVRHDPAVRRRRSRPAAPPSRADAAAAQAHADLGPAVIRHL